MIQFLKTMLKKTNTIVKGDTDWIVGLQEVREGYAINKEGNVIAFLTLNGINLDLASPLEVDMLLKRMLDFFDTRLLTPIAFNVSNKKSSLDTHNKVYDSTVNSSNTLTPDSKRKLKMFARLNNLAYSQRFNIPERQYIITLSYRVNLKTSQSYSLKNLDGFNFFTQEQWTKIKGTLDDNVERVIYFLNSGSNLNLGVRMMTEDEIYLYFKNYYGANQYKILDEESRFLL